eukprot:CAMPEP_0197621974 /NCGR_PEP_ID=MMETSP1338-20131121/2386_1 /TAXON_ID=43686 ORGANISM="Pelagodinium beii, Strain RCC1491" /NCGR_SAMPLE_ID=MMETSP1338 /ASSEMBLY_ACC=CAM_ASM_000754 /LENGTH=104 /DNA_ID=CAMNT_0043191567 /DNA_START=73 /DNA_END=387 /DNA_ORIENTATION=+
MAARRPVLCVAALAAVCLWMLYAPAQEEELFVVSTPALRASSLASGSFAGAESKAEKPLLLMKALPEPRPNDAALPVELNRTSFYWGLLTICVLSILFSSYFFN